MVNHTNIGREEKPLPTVNELSLAIRKAELEIEIIMERLAVYYGISVEAAIKEDELKLGLYHAKLKIVKINGVQLG